ncbi:MAG TPA: hypothetical protein VJX67_14075, partial [Blastocatellia bacterium]|nr:hypothetical protein [Blastocatellia bacterium]
MKLTHDAELKTTLAKGSEFQSTHPRLNRYAVLSASSFIHKYWLKLAAISAIVLVPCLWHRRILASDLGSHLYNAWLAQLVRHGQVPGLWLA